jgi:hypothetical protein
MNDPHENIDHDPFSDDGTRRRSRLRGNGVVMRRRQRRAQRCAAATAGRGVLRIVRRPCPCGPRGVERA